MSNKLLMKITLAAPGAKQARHYHYLSVWERPDTSISYELRSSSTATSFSLSNMQMRLPLPTWNNEKDMTTLIRASVLSGVYRFIGVEYPPKPATPKKAAPGTVWVIDEESWSYSWRVIAATEAGALREFKRMWNLWCKNTGADPYYWGDVGDKWSDITATEVKMGAGYMDKELFK